MDACFTARRTLRGYIPIVEMTIEDLAPGAMMGWMLWKRQVLLGSGREGHGNVPPDDEPVWIPVVPDAAASSTGAVGAHYSSFEAHGESNVAEAAISHDGGRSFTSNRVASSPTVVEAATGQRGTGIQGHVGDYFGAAFAGDGFFASWQDGREGTRERPFTAAFLCRIPMA